MIFAPHVLQKKTVVPMEKDEFGRPIPNSGEESWEDICLCRCDDNSTKEFKSENGEVYRPNFHIVCEMNVDVKEGDEVRCSNGDEVRGAGKVYMVKRANYFYYSEIWI